MNDKDKSLKEEFCSACAELAERATKEVLAQEDAAEQMFPDAGMPADTQEAEEDLPTAPCEPLFSAEDMSEGAAEGEQNAETEGGAE